MTMIGYGACIESLKRMEGLARFMEDRMNMTAPNEENPFQSYESVISASERKLQEQGAVSPNNDPRVIWEGVQSGKRSKSDLSAAVVERLCATPRIAMSDAFLSFVSTDQRTINERALVALVRSYHHEWADILNRFRAIDLIKSRFLDHRETTHPQLQLWMSNMRLLIDVNDADNLSIEAMNSRLAPRDIAQRFGIDEASSYLSGVIGTTVRRICQKFRTSPEDLEYLSSHLLPYRAFHPRDLGRALSKVILLNNGMPPSEIREAVRRAAAASPALGEYRSHRIQWETLIDKQALDVYAEWPTE